MAHLRQLRGFDGELNSILRDAATHAARMTHQLAGEPGIGAQVRAAQYAQSRAALIDINNSIWDKVEGKTIKGMDQASKIASDMLNRVNRMLGSAIETPGIRADFIANSYQRIEHLRSRMILNIDLAPSVYRNKQLTMGWVDRVVNRGILTSKSAAEIAKDVRDLIRPDVHGGVSYAAKRLGRTELNNAFHETTKRAAVGQPWVEGMQWQLSGSHPRPDICNEYAEANPANLGAGIYPTREVPSKPHPQCLCYITAVTVPQDKFLDDLFAGKYDYALLGDE